MVNSDHKRTYIESEEDCEITVNQNDNYSKIAKIWVKWLKSKSMGISVYSYRMYYFHLMQNHYSASTIKMNLAMMRKRILYLFDITNNEIDKRANLEYKMKQIKAPSVVIKGISNEKIFSKEEIKNLISSTGKRTSLIVEFLYITACRRSELCNIFLRDCKIKRDYVEVTFYSGKGNKNRSVPIPVEIYNKILNVFVGKKYLFENISMSQYDGHTIWTMVSAAGMKYLNRKLSPHMLRHTRLTHLNKDTGDLKAVSLFAGHSSIKVTADVYISSGFDKKILLGSIEDQ